MLDKKQKYLQIALNSTLNEAHSVISQIPLDKRIIIEAGTPLIKAYGIKGIRTIRNWWEERIFGSSLGLSPSPVFTSAGMIGLLAKSLEKKIKQNKKGQIAETVFAPYIVADLKCMDRGLREVEIAREGGANAAVALGHAPIETLDAFIENCEKAGLDSMIDMMNFEFPLNIIRQLKKPPQVVILHRGVDEETFNPEKEIPFHEIQRIKSDYDIMIAVAGGDTFEEARRAVFNDADIVVVWKSFYKSSIETAKLAEEFLKEIR
ncbi:MAG TPA: orotidine 5'-phosphate decarboxylase / HUMPS family protein [Candidatus Humimicrobiaceae bacterium]|nr:orotidine 5'-phosphate decarboxylase / HUMPS family protein [Candidatus Humimicrobiaceae bacterium]